MRMRLWIKTFLFDIYYILLLYNILHWNFLWMKCYELFSLTIHNISFGRAHFFSVASLTKLLYSIDKSEPSDSGFIPNVNHVQIITYKVPHSVPTQHLSSITRNAAPTPNRWTNNNIMLVVKGIANDLVKLIGSGYYNFLFNLKAGGLDGRMLMF